MQPKVASHAGQCGSHTFTCIDCSRTFDRWSVAGHTTCVTEHEKYAQGATKPGGYASKGCFVDGAAQQAAPAAHGGIVGAEFLTERAPWRCNICSVACTSRESLEGHATGAKHQRRARAALAAAAGNGSGQAAGKEGATEADAAKAQESSTVPEAAAPQAAAKRPREEETAPAPGSGKKIKWKKLATAELRKSGGEMKLKRLTAAVLKAAGRGEESSTELLQKLEGSGQFKLQEKLISLVSA